MIQNLTPAEWEALVDAEIAWHEQWLPVDEERAPVFAERSALLNGALQKVKQLAPPHVDPPVPLRETPSGVLPPHQP